MVPRRTIRVATPSRLHFGLLSFGNRERRQFGGIGAMIERPGVVVEASEADEFEVVSDREGRLAAIAEVWRESVGGSELPNYRVEIVSAPPLHSGLGVGTQLALATATALDAISELGPGTIEELASRVGRGVRSAVGAYGFQMGGLISELGKLPSDVLAPLDARVAIPRDWRFLLIAPETSAGLSGGPERQAFEKLPPVPEEVTAELQANVSGRLLPSAREADFAEFSKAVYDYGHLAGSCFELIQGGPYNGERLTNLVQHVRSLGVSGVGQSSWGPTIFAMCENDSEALQLRNELLNSEQAEPTEIVITPPNNSGARIETDA